MKKPVPQFFFGSFTKIILLLFTACIFYTHAQAQGWSELGTGSNALLANQQIKTIVTDANGIVYATGYFTNLDGYYYVAKWDGTSWSELGSESNALNANSGINTLALDAAGNVYAAGNFRNSSNQYYVAKWDGTSWNELGTGSNALNANSAVQVLATDHLGNVFATGNFTNSSGSTYVAVFNGVNWRELGGNNSLQANNRITCMVLNNSAMYVAGDFTNANGDYYVAKFDGLSWAELGTGSNALAASSNILTLTLDPSGNIYAAGAFRNAADNNYNYVAKWNGTNWNSLGTGSNGLNPSFYILSITSDPTGNIYAAGYFTNGDGYRYVAQWNGTNWTELGSGSEALYANSNIWSITSDASGNLYAGGEFTDGDGGNFVAKWTAPPVVPTAITHSSAGQSINIYPNPSKGNVHFDVSETVNVSVYNFSGVLLHAQTVNAGTASVDLSNQTAGVYTLIFKGETTSYAPVKVVKE